MNTHTRSVIMCIHVQVNAHGHAYWHVYVHGAYNNYAHHGQVNVHEYGWTANHIWDNPLYTHHLWGKADLGLSADSPLIEREGEIESERACSNYLRHAYSMQASTSASHLQITRTTLDVTLWFCGPTLNSAMTRRFPLWVALKLKFAVPFTILDSVTSPSLFDEVLDEKST